ncbi:hypothetical protein NLO83_16280 [Pseudomonas tremae]|uniref:hypothetical protein n=1 Tax=Pseudomonas syringae group TaxID=136849 RepID=UPI0002E3DE2B|nr:MULTISPECIES: hypothetical protein [Pseudomonas syringae group]MCQ3017139.1 hypothetical protein [Pseudomonas tremae]QGL54966.1 hypothetical protein POR16_00770 [Pseudomonas coronafaciens pv. oryzae str. 1_6]RMM33755.1 hypothetical protein ALQ80_03026 [Pseudomonas coronafaciens pv. oryzae]
MFQDFRKLTDKIKDQSLELEFPSLSLVNRKSEFRGAGRISQSRAGRFEITVYPDTSSLDIYRLKDSEYLSHEVPAGHYLGEESYFRFVGVALDGTKWEAHDVWITSEVNYVTRGLVLRAHVALLYTCSKKNTAASYAQYTTAIQRNFNFPCNAFSTTAFSKSRNVSEFTIRGVSCRLVIHHDTLDIKTSSDKPMPSRFHWGLYKALQFVAASQLELVTSYERINTTWIYHLTALQADLRLWSGESPVGDGSPSEFENSVAALDSLMGCFLEQDIPRFWPLYIDVTYSYFTGQNAVALAISVAVEGVADAYFKNYSNADPEHMKECVAAIPVFEMLVKNQPELFSEKVIRRVINSLNGAGRPSNKNTLYALFVDKLVDDWNSIRHVSAHGVVGQADDQKMYDCICSCLHMFYSMVFAHAGYTGLVVDIAEKQGRPVENPVFGILQQRDAGIG